MSFKIGRVVYPWQKFSYFPSLVFLAFLHEVRGNGVEKSDGARFSKKNVGAQIWAKRGQNGPKMSFFAFFSIKNHQNLLVLHMVTESDGI